MEKRKVSFKIMKNKTLGICLIGVIIISVFLGITQIKMNGFEMALLQTFKMFFGIWSGIRLMELIKCNEKNAI